jgi:RNA polymerase sigma-70 factor (ECF subfamily)
MGYLRLVHSPSSRTEENACVAAFDAELDYVFETLRRLGAGPSEVEDLAHDVFVVLHRHWPTLDTERPLRPYLFGIAYRLVFSQRRRRAREILAPQPELESNDASPEQLVQGQESLALLLAALERVPPPRRAVLIMYDLDEMPVSEIAKTLSITRFGVYARLRKARKELAAAVKQLQNGARK